MRQMSCFVFLDGGVDKDFLHISKYSSTSISNATFENDSDFKLLIFDIILSTIDISLIDAIEYYNTRERRYGGVTNV